MDIDYDDIIDTSLITGKFVVITTDGQWESYTRYDDIPAEFQTLVSFMPDQPSEDGHSYEWIDLMDELYPATMERGTAC